MVERKSTKAAHSKTVHGSMELTRLTSSYHADEPQTAADSQELSIFGITEVPHKKNVITESFIDDMLKKR